MAIEPNQFSLLDYVVFIGIMVSCFLIGIYFGFIKKAQDTKDYLIGRRQLSAVPVAMSLLVSFISGITFLGLPAELYVFGLDYWYIWSGAIMAGILTHIFFLPILADMELTSAYQYLEERFDRRVRQMGALFFVISTCVWLPVVVYVPSLAINQVTNFDIANVSLLMSILCIFYTCVGGIKAVVWTDFIQTIVQLGTVLLILTVGTIKAGGLLQIWEINSTHERITIPDFSFDIFKRHTFWSIFIGGTLFMLQGSATNQIMIQRYQSLPNRKACYQALWVFIFSIVTTFCIFTYIGLIIFAVYYDCDPLSTKAVTSKDQLLPLLVSDIFRNWNGISGLFIAGIFSASLSSLSGGLNSLAAVFLEDFYKPLFGKITEFHTNLVIKIAVVIFGIFIVGLSSVVDKLGGVVQVAISFQSVTSGTSLALFILGVLAPWISSRAVMAGGICSVILMSWIVIGAQLNIAAGNIQFATLPMSVEGCSRNETFTTKITEDKNDVFLLFRVSYLFYTSIGCLTTIGVSLIYSCLFGWRKNIQEIDPKLLYSGVRKFVRKEHIPEIHTRTGIENSSYIYDKN